MLGSVIVAGISLSACSGGNTPNSPDVRKDSVANATEKMGRDFTLRVYLDKSASMKGYLDGASEFVDFIDDYVSSVAIQFGKPQPDLPHCVGVEFYFLDQEAHLFAEGYENVAKSLFSPANFNAKYSETHAMILKLLSLQTKDVVSLFFTDGIFESEKDVVGRMPIEIRTQLAKSLGEDTIDCRFIRLSSQFSGYYYPPAPKATSIKYNGTRPYFCWIMGRPEILSSIASSEYLNEIKATRDGYASYAGICSSPASYTVLRDSYGRYDIEENGKGEIPQLTDVKRDRNGRFVVRIAFSLPTKLLDASYILDSTNYEVTPSVFNLSVERFKQQGKYDYVMKLSLPSEVKSIPNGEVVVALKRNTTDWSEFAEHDGLRQIDGKTYGIDYLINGIQRAYELQFGKNYTELKIKIKD